MYGEEFDKIEKTEVTKLLRTQIEATEHMQESLSELVERPAVVGEVKIVDAPKVQVVEVANTPKVQKVYVENPTEVKVEKVEQKGVIGQLKKLGELVRELTTVIKSQPKPETLQLPEVQKVELTNPQKIEKIDTNVPVQEAGVNTNPTVYVPVRLTNGEEFYTAISNVATTLGNVAGMNKIWLREEYTWITVSGMQVTSRIVHFDHIQKVTEDIEYDVNANPIVKTRKVESSKA